MSKLDFMQIDATPANVAEMMTRGLWRWDDLQQAVLDQLYGFKDEGERQARAWVRGQFA